MNEPVWVLLPAIIIIHDRQIARHGGIPGMRDRTLLESGAARPLNRHAYGETDPSVLGAAYAYGISKAHAFVDGNKRTAFVTMATFLRLNGFGFRPDLRDGLAQMEGLASGAVEEAAFAEWLAQGAVDLTR